MDRLWVLLVASCQENQENQESPELRRRRRWARLFDQLDLNKDGRIDLRELRVGLAKRGVSRSSVDKFVLAGDTNQDGELDFEEFSRYLHTHEKQLRLMFSNLDRNHDVCPQVKSTQQRSNTLCAPSVWTSAARRPTGF